MTKLPPPPWETHKTCINCFKLILKESVICSECSHNQSLPVKKKTANIKDMVSAIVLGAYGGHLRQKDIEFINEIIGKNVSEEIINKAITEIIILRLAITSILFLRHYQYHPKFIEIIAELKKQTDDLFNNIFDNNEAVWHYFNKMIHEYSAALEDENQIETITKILQFILERIIAGHNIAEIITIGPLKDIAKEWAYPIWYKNMKCAFFVDSFIEFITLWNNKWEIE